MAAVVIISSEDGLRIEVHCRNQPNNKLVLCKLLLHFNSCFLNISNKMEYSTSVIKVCVVYVDALQLSCVKKLALATDKWLRVSNATMLFNKQ